MKNKFKKGLPRGASAKWGFTLVEMLIAVGLFVVVATISMGAVLSIFDANRKAQSSKTVVDNLNLSIENMARTVRFGSSYYCGTSDSLSATNDDSNGCDSVSVTFYDETLSMPKDVRIIYSWDSTNKSIKRSYEDTDEGSITSPETVIEYLKFYVSGATDNPSLKQPYVIAVIKGYSGSKPTSKTTFSIETLMSQRKRDY